MIVAKEEVVWRRGGIRRSRPILSLDAAIGAVRVYLAGFVDLLRASIQLMTLKQPCDGKKENELIVSCSTKWSRFVRRMFTAGVGLGLAGCSAGDVDFVDLATLERPSSPNTYLVCPAERTTAAVDREPPIYELAPGELEQIWLEALAEEPRLSRRGAEPERRRYLFVQRTRVLRFPDVIQLEVLDVPPDRATLCLYSRSIYGYGDLGTNRARVEDWLARIGPASP